MNAAMSDRLISDASIKGLPIGLRFIEYANAYLSAAQSLCALMEHQESTRTWPNASVVLMLSAHAVELFIKGMVLSRDGNIVLDGHNLESLNAVYFEHFPEASFHWAMPFKTSYVGFEEAEIAELRRQQTAHSVLYRYPVARGGGEWNGVYGLVPGTFSSVLSQVARDFQRLRDQLQ